MANCPWYVPDFACEAAEQACKDAVKPYVQTAGFIGLVLLLTGVVRFGSFAEAKEEGEKRRKKG